MEDVYTRVGKKLKELRAKRGQTQAVVAEEAEISVAFLSFLENGRKKGSLETYDKLSRALKVGLDVLFKESRRGGGNNPKHRQRN